MSRSRENTKPGRGSASDTHPPREKTRSLTPIRRVWQGTPARAQQGDLSTHGRKEPEKAVEHEEGEPEKDEPAKADSKKKGKRKKTRDDKEEELSPPEGGGGNEGGGGKKDPPPDGDS